MSEPSPFYSSPGHFGSHFGSHAGAHAGSSIPGLDCVSGIGRGYIGVDGFPFNGLGYPFAYPHEAATFIEDMHVSWEAEPSAEVHLKSITGLGILASGHEVELVNEVDLIIESQDGSISLDTRQMEHRVRVWCGDLKVHTWIGESAVVQAVLRHNPALSDHYEFEELVLDQRAVDFRPVALRDLVVGETGGQVSVLSQETKTLHLASGYNLQATAQDIRSPRGERQSKLTLDAVPGAGLGLFPGCDADLGVTALGRARPTPDGDLLAGGVDCIGLRPKLNYTAVHAEIDPGKFEIYDSCTAKCSCDDFASVANYAIALWNKYRILAERISNIRDRYHEVRAKIKTWQECVQGNPLRLHIWQAPPCSIGIGMGICNVGDECLDGLSINMRIDDGAGGTLGEMDSYHAYQTQYSGGLAYNRTTSYSGSGANFSVPLNAIEPGRMGFVFMRYNFSGTCTPSGEVEVSVGGTLPDSWKPIDPILKTFDFTP